MKEIFFLRCLAIILSAFFLSFSCGYEAIELINIQNNTDYSLYAVFSTEYPNTYFPRSEKYEYVEMCPSCPTYYHVETSREDYFKKCQVLQIICYKRNDKDELNNTKVDFMRSEHCELIIYEFTQKQLESMDWTVIITKEEIEMYQSSHKTLPIIDER